MVRSRLVPLAALLLAILPAGCHGGRIGFTSFEEPAVQDGGTGGLASDSFLGSCETGCALPSQPGKNARGYTACATGRAEIGFQAEYIGEPNTVRAGVAESDASIRSDGFQLFTAEGDTLGGAVRVTLDAVDLVASRGGVGQRYASCLVKADFRAGAPAALGAGSWQVPSDATAGDVVVGETIGFTSFEEARYESQRKVYVACSGTVQLQPHRELGFATFLPTGYLAADSDVGVVDGGESDAVGAQHGSRHFILGGSGAFAYVQIDPVRVVDYADVQVFAWANVQNISSEVQKCGL